MENSSQSPEERDPRLWAIAKKRAGFKSHLVTYLIVNAFFWALWFFTDGNDGDTGWPWPVWPTLGWGVAILFGYFDAYVYPEANSVEREYEKLKRKQQ